MNVSVESSGLQIGMTEKFFDGQQVNALLQQVSCKAMPDSVWSGYFIKSCCLSYFHHESLNRTNRKPRSVLIYKYCLSLFNSYNCTTIFEMCSEEARPICFQFAPPSSLR